MTKSELYRNAMKKTVNQEEQERRAKEVMKKIAAHKGCGAHKKEGRDR